MMANMKYRPYDIFPRLFVEYGADLNYKDNLGRDALYYVSSTFHIDGVKFMIDQGCDYKLVDINGKTFLDTIDRSKDTFRETVKYIDLIECSQVFVLFFCSGIKRL